MTAFPDSATRWGPRVETLSPRDAFQTTLQPFPGFQTLPSTISLSYLHSLHLSTISYNLLKKILLRYWHHQLLQGLLNQE